jgi:hypothetical protein
MHVQQSPSSVRWITSNPHHAGAEKSYESGCSRRAAEKISIRAPMNVPNARAMTLHFP